MRRPKRSTVLVALVVLLLATIPILVPLLVTKAGGVTVIPAPVALADATAPVPMQPRPSTTAPTTPPPPAVTTLAPTGTTPTSTPTPTPSPTPAATTATATVPAPGSRTPEPSPTEDQPTVLSAGVDLTVVAIRWSPSPPTTGQSVVFSATVRNTGSDPTPAETQDVAFSVDGTKVTWSAGSTEPLAAGQERTYTADGGTAGNGWLATPGTHTVEAWADDTARIPELNENNNTATTTFTV